MGPVTVVLRLSAVVALAWLVGCASAPDAGSSEKPTTSAADQASAAEENDALEPINRHIFEFNLLLDDYLVRPVAEAYGDFVPDLVKTGIRNVLNNLREPWTLVNDLAQGEFGRAQETYGRFLLNSTYGVLGIFDVAKDYGVEQHREDFGQTLAVWGVPEGSYLVLPLFGPSNLRDAVGRGAQWYADPVSLAADEIGVGSYFYARTTLNIIDTRWRAIHTFDALRKDSLDFYAAVRSFYRQRRSAEIRNVDRDTD